MAILASLIPDATLENISDAEMKALEGRITRALVTNPEILQLIKTEARITEFLQRKN